MNKAGRGVDEALSEVLRGQSNPANSPIADPSMPFYTVGQVSRMLDVQPAFLRRLDSESVVSPQRSDGHQRRYSHHDIVKVRRTVQLVAEGMTLAGIRRVMILEQEVTFLRAELAQERSKKETR